MIVCVIVDLIVDITIEITTADIAAESKETFFTHQSLSFSCKNQIGHLRTKPVYLKMCARMSRGRSSNDKAEVIAGRVCNVIPVMK